MKSEIYTQFDNPYMDVYLEISPSGILQNDQAVWRAQTTWDGGENQMVDEVVWTYAPENNGYDDVELPPPPEILNEYERRKEEIMLTIVTHRLKGE